MSCKEYSYFCRVENSTQTKAIAGSAWLFAVNGPEASMQPVHQPTKAEERALMRELMEERERRTPEHQVPEWVRAFWLRKQVMS